MTDEPIAMTSVPLLHYQDLVRKAGELRALLARQPAAIGKREVTPVRIADAERAAYKVSGHRAGEKWTKAFAEALLATPLAKEASKPAPSVEQDERGAWPCAEDAAIAACALMIKGICMTKPQAEWTKGIEERIRFMLKRASK